MSTPLAERIRAKNLDEFVGQKHLVGKGSVLRQMIESGMLPSIILWGPPGVGKTTLANIIAKTTDRPFYTLNAVSSGVKDVREIIEKSKRNLLQNKTPILFIDEIHRFSKSQQDSLLNAVEKGVVTLIGATTENPSFEVISPLLSRSQLHVLKHLEADDLKQLLQHAITNDKELFEYKIDIQEYEMLFQASGGDARKLLGFFELLIHSSNSKQITITNNWVKDKLNHIPLQYDKDGENHYDIASALIKSIRGSDPNAAVYWLARMIEGGEDPKFIARRLLISASEDIGNANPTALVIANNCFSAVQAIGYPEAQIVLSQTATYLASSPKSNASYLAIKNARGIVKETGNLPVPLHLRNAATKLMKELDYGKGYKYAHDYPNSFINQEFLPDAIAGQKYYEPGANARENELRNRLKKLWGEKYMY